MTVDDHFEQIGYPRRCENVAAVRARRNDAAPQTGGASGVYVSN
jgi:hypothetical protein